jgi:small conductance mechanosensitive channel
MNTSFRQLAKYFTAQNLADSMIGIGWRVLSAIIVLAIGYSLMRVLLTLLQTTLRRTVHDVTVRHYVMSAARITLWVTLCLVLLGIFGIETTSLVAVVGAAGLAVGLALQGSLSNFAAGFMLLIFRPFKAGDEVEVAGVAGVVIEIGIFSTVIDMPDNVRAFVPNSSIFSGVIKNRSLNEFLRVDMKVTLAGNADISKAQQVIHRLLANNDMILDVPPPEVKVIEDESSGVTLAIHPYTNLKNVDAVRTTVSRDVREELRRIGVEVLRQ